MKMPPWPVVRDAILFFVGVGGVIFEVFFRRPPDYGVLPVLAGFAGLPAFLRRDDKEDGNGNDSGRNDNALPGG